MKYFKPLCLLVSMKCWKSLINDQVPPISEPVPVFHAYVSKNTKPKLITMKKVWICQRVSGSRLGSRAETRTRTGIIDYSDNPGVRGYLPTFSRGLGSVWWKNCSSVFHAQSYRTAVVPSQAAAGQKGCAHPARAALSTLWEMDQDPDPARPSKD